MNGNGYMLPYHNHKNFTFSDKFPLHLNTLDIFSFG